MKSEILTYFIKLVDTLYNWFSDRDAVSACSELIYYLTEVQALYETLSMHKHWVFSITRVLYIISEKYSYEFFRSFAD
jgi:hypothetical protein